MMDEDFYEEEEEDFLDNEMCLSSYRKNIIDNKDNNKELNSWEAVLINNNEELV